MEDFINQLNHHKQSLIEILHNEGTDKDKVNKIRLYLYNNRNQINLEFNEPDPNDLEGMLKQVSNLFNNYYTFVKYSVAIKNICCIIKNTEITDDYKIQEISSLLI